MHAVLEHLESLFFLQNERSSLTSISATGGIVATYVLNLSGFGYTLRTDRGMNVQNIICS